MSVAIPLEFRRRPSVLAYMVRALYPSPGLRKTGGFPPLRARWLGLSIDRKHLDACMELTGLRAEDGLPILYPHIFGFPVLMAILTHPAFPLPIWNALQVRNHLLQHRRMSADVRYDLETRVAGQRVLEKGAEVDLHTLLRDGSELVWESLNTFYFRGRHGEPTARSPLASSPKVEGPASLRWHMPAGVGLRFGGLTGDYNGIHYARWYARRLGFPGPFHHPQLVLGQTLARLPPHVADAQRLDVWLKGPVFYGIDVEVRTESDPTGRSFAIAEVGAERPAIVGRWSRVPPKSRVVDERDQPVATSEDAVHDDGGLTGAQTPRTGAPGEPGATRGSTS